MKNMKKKGFTLVELLVVIAILAILATVSVIGYTAFVDKADQSKAVTELTQVKTLVRSELMVGSVTLAKDNVTGATDDVVLSIDTNGLVIKYKSGSAPTGEVMTAALQALVAKDVDFVTNLAVSGNDVTYTTNGVTATWDVSADTVTAN